MEVGGYLLLRCASKTVHIIFQVGEVVLGKGGGDIGLYDFFQQECRCPRLFFILSVCK